MAEARTKVLTTNSEAGATAADRQAFLKLTEQAAKGDTKAVAQVRALCNAHPELWNAIRVDVAGTVRDAHLKLLTGEDELARDAVNRNLEKMKRDILGANPSPLERLLAERICACWVQVQHAEWLFATKVKAGVSLQFGDYLQRLVDRANHRYMAAIRALAQIRRLTAPVVQVNVAEKQINVATTQMNALPVTSAEAIAESSMPALATGDDPSCTDHGGSDTYQGAAIRRIVRR